MMHNKKRYKGNTILLFFFLLMLSSSGTNLLAQINPKDSLKKSDATNFKEDSLLNYDELFNDLESFVDSILVPKSYFMPAISFARGYYNFYDKDTQSLYSKSKIGFTPSLTYYHKSGWGLSASGYAVNDNKKLNFYQWSVTASYDYVKNHDLATGISYSNYFKKKDLPFYVTPLKHEASAYFTYRKFWLKPMLMALYGWGSRSQYQENRNAIQQLQLINGGSSYVYSTESIADFSLQASVRHDFFWRNVLSSKDYIRLTPRINFVSGTQKFGFNQSTDMYRNRFITGDNYLFRSNNSYLTSKSDFKPLAISFQLSTEYVINRFSIQPQVIGSYYFQSKSQKQNFFYALNAAWLF